MPSHQDFPGIPVREFPGESPSIDIDMADFDGGADQLQIEGDLIKKHEIKPRNCNCKSKR